MARSDLSRAKDDDGFECLFICVDDTLIFFNDQGKGEIMGRSFRDKFDIRGSKKLQCFWESRLLVKAIKSRYAKNQKWSRS